MPLFLSIISILYARFIQTIDKNDTLKPNKVIEIYFFSKRSLIGMTEGF